jgi:hypothetical protein
MAVTLVFFYGSAALFVHRGGRARPSITSRQRSRRKAGARRCSRTMPKATKAGRQMARFDEGELWCADDAVPPVSPAGWYFRPGGGPLVWIGPFPTAEAAKVAPCGGDPFTAARRRLDAWVRAREEPRSESPAEAEVAVDGSIDARRIRVDSAATQPATSDPRRRTDIGPDAGPNVEPDGTRPRRARRADPGAPDKHARLAPARVATVEQTASATCNGATAPSPRSTTAHGADPVARQPGQVAAGGRGPPRTQAPLPAASSAPRQLAFGFGQGAEAANSDGREALLPAEPRRRSKRRDPDPLVQETLPLHEPPSGPATGD